MDSKKILDFTGDIFIYIIRGIIAFMVVAFLGLIAIALINNLFPNQSFFNIIFSAVAMFSIFCFGGYLFGYLQKMNPEYKRDNTIIGKMAICVLFVFMLYEFDYHKKKIDIETICVVLSAITGALVGYKFANKKLDQSEVKLDDFLKEDAEIK